MRWSPYPARSIHKGELAIECLRYDSINPPMNPKIAPKTITCALCAGLLLLSAGLTASANTLVTFQVDMSVQVGSAAFDPSTQTVAVHGSFNSWGTFVLTNNPNGA